MMTESILASNALEWWRAAPYGSEKRTSVPRLKMLVRELWHAYPNLDQIEVERIALENRYATER